MGNTIPAERLTHIIIGGVTDDYAQIKHNAKRDPDFSLGEVYVIIRNIYINRVARGVSARKQHGRESAMFAASPEVLQNW